MRLKEIAKGFVKMKTTGDKIEEIKEEQMHVGREHFKGLVRRLEEAESKINTLMRIVDRLKIDHSVALLKPSKVTMEFE